MQKELLRRTSADPLIEEVVHSGLSCVSLIVELLRLFETIWGVDKLHIKVVPTLLHSLYRISADDQSSDYTTRGPGTSHIRPHYYPPGPPQFPVQQTGLITVPAALSQPPPPGTPVGVWITRPSSDPAHPAPLLYYQPYTGYGVAAPPIVPPLPTVGAVGPPALTSVAVQAEAAPSMSHRSSMNCRQTCATWRSIYLKVNVARVDDQVSCLVVKIICLTLLLTEEITADYFWTTVINV